MEQSSRRCATVPGREGECEQVVVDLDEVAIARLRFCFATMCICLEALITALFIRAVRSLFPPFPLFARFSFFQMHKAGVITRFTCFTSVACACKDEAKEMIL